MMGCDRKDGPERDLERRAFNRCLSISMERLPEVRKLSCEASSLSGLSFPAEE